MPLPPIIHEDDFLLAFDKPAGMPVAPDRRHKGRENLMALVHGRYGDGVASVHRLDAETSGVLLCARTKPALDFLSGQFQSKTAGRVYHALVVVLPTDEAMNGLKPVRGEDGALPEAFTVDLALGEDEERPGLMRVCKKRGGLPSVTGFRTLERFGRFAWVECQPVTGRTHQVRVHLAAAGAPVVRDPSYGVPHVNLLLSDLKRGYKGRGEEKPLVTRLALHASSLTVKHPETRATVTLASDLPPELAIALKYLRKFAVHPARR